MRLMKLDPKGAKEYSDKAISVIPKYSGLFGQTRSCIFKKKKKSGKNNKRFIQGIRVYQIFGL